MLNLTEYKNHAIGPIDYPPWACLIAPGVIFKKDGIYQRTFVHRGPDLEKSTDAELVALTARLNTMLKRSGSGWAMFFEAQRIPAQGYPADRFADPVSWLFDDERRAPFDGQGRRSESLYLLTFAYLPLPEIADRTECSFFERHGPSVEPDHSHAHLNAFLTETDLAAERMRAFLPELAPLDDTQTLTYLHGTIATEQHVVNLPQMPAELDAFLGNASLADDVTPRLDDEPVPTVPEFPDIARPGLRDELNDLGVSDRWMTCRITLDKVTTNKQLSIRRRQQCKSDGAVLREVMLNRETALVDRDADNTATDAALKELSADDAAAGGVTTLLVISYRGQQAVDEQLLERERLFSSRNFSTICETLDAVEAWLGSSTGNAFANARQPNVYTLNRAHMMPVSAIWARPSHNAHLNAPALMLTETGRLSLRDVQRTRPVTIAMISAPSSRKFSRASVTDRPLARMRQSTRFQMAQRLVRLNGLGINPRSSIHRKRIPTDEGEPLRIYRELTRKFWVYPRGCGVNPQEYSELSSHYH